ncbi:MAG: hypothetical protein PVG71_14580 [Anaerolineae bacterium]
MRGRVYLSLVAQLEAARRALGGQPAATPLPTTRLDRGRALFVICEWFQDSHYGLMPCAQRG